MKNEIIEAIQNKRFYGFVSDEWENMNDDTKKELLLNYVFYFEELATRPARRELIADLKDRLEV